MQIVAPCDGVILSVADVPRITREDELTTWSGSPLEERNLQAYLNAGDTICRVGDPQKFEALLTIDQRDVEFVQPGQAVEIVLDAQPDRRRTTRLVQIAQLDMPVSPASLSAKSGGDLPTWTDSSGRERPTSATYQASALLDDLPGRLFEGATGKARIRVGNQTVAERAWRLICQTVSVHGR
jgi:hypothetical protein